MLVVMELPRTRELLPMVLWRASSPSTNAELRELALEAAAEGDPLPHGTLLVTDTQTAGRGRLDRGWETPPGRALAASLLVRGYGEVDSGGGSAPGGSAPAGSAPGGSAPGGSAPDWGGLGPAWLPLIAGSAVRAALQPFFAIDPTDPTDPTYPGDARKAKRVGTKWPNDVHVRTEDDAMAGSPGKKLCGILCELLPDGSAIVGMGMNLLIPEWELPTERSTSLLAAGGDVGELDSFASPGGAELVDRVLAGVAGELLALAELAGRDPGAIRVRAGRDSLTLGTEVRVHLPNEEVVDGRARALAADGSLTVDLPTGGELIVSAGDVQHLR